MEGYYTVLDQGENIAPTVFQFRLDNGALTFLKKDVFDVDRDGSTDDFLIDQVLEKAEGIDPVDLMECDDW
ncbi:MAG: hypothetical protein CSB44_07000 [Gammaproteobacteria bacterium]|nr:MAG: hypothetical protein CSB44_07000 [Gammaproteobacteria bacterium]